MGSIAVPPSGKKSEPLPLYFDNTASFIHYVGTGTDYTISANESRAFFITNGKNTAGHITQYKFNFTY